jgi:hypothetical protein
MALKLDLSLDGLDLQTLSLSMPEPGPSGSPSRPDMSSYDFPRPPMRWTTTSAAILADSGRLDPVNTNQPEPQSGWDTETNSSQSIMSFGSCPSTAPPLSDLPLTPIPELLHTPTKRTMQVNVNAPGASPNMATPAHSIPRTDAARSVDRQQQHLASKLPSPLDNEPIVVQLAQGESDVGVIRNVCFPTTYIIRAYLADIFSRFP